MMLVYKPEDRIHPSMALRHPYVLFGENTSLHTIGQSSQYMTGSGYAMANGAYEDESQNSSISEHFRGRSYNAQSAGYSRVR
jgi:hypothetical protein